MSQAKLTQQYVGLKVYIFLSNEYKLSYIDLLYGKQEFRAKHDFVKNVYFEPIYDHANCTYIRKQTTSIFIKSSSLLLTIHRQQDFIFAYITFYI